MCAARQILNDSPLVALGMLHFTFVKALRSHLLASYRSCFVNIIKVSMHDGPFKVDMDPSVATVLSTSFNPVCVKDLSKYA